MYIWVGRCSPANHNLRSGATLRETTLTPANVNVRQFGRIFTLKVDGDVYADHLGKFHNGENPGVIQSYALAGGIYSAPAYWNQHVYVLADGDFLSDFSIERGRLSRQPAKKGTDRFPNPGATPSVSANGARDGIVWLIGTKTWNGPNQPAVLHAYDALDVARELYSSEQSPARDRLGLATRFGIPTVANGRVYAGAKGEVDVSGLMGR